MAKIMIVEDNKMNMSLFVTLLETNDYEIIELTDGTDFISTTKEVMPDLILMDIHLPGKMGTELTEELRADDEIKHLKVVALTSFAMSGDRERIMKSGMDEYVTKPIKPLEFLKFIENILN